MSTSPRTTFRGVEVDPNRDGAEVVDPEISAALVVLREALAGLATFNLVIAHEVANLGVPIFTKEIDTMAVTIGGDGIVRLLLNPGFVANFGAANVMFGLAHEVDHVVLAHLCGDDDLGSDDQAVLAREVVINHRVSRLLQRGVPTEDGKPAVVDPKGTHQSYRTALKKAGEEPVDFDRFVVSDIVCAAELRRMPRPPSRQLAVMCPRSKGELPDGGTGQPQSAGIDPEQGGKIVDQVLDAVMKRAVRGDESARDTLLDLGETLGEDHPIWGNLGLGALRGETPPPAQVSFWEQYLVNALASVLVPGARLVYPKKLIGFEDLYAGHGFRLPFQPVGDERQTKVLVAVDTSGSMGADVLRRIAQLVGTIPGAEASWVAFDAEVYPFEPGEPLRGGGGTSFRAVQDWIAGRQDDSFDCILMVTDGHAEKIHPADADRWVWLITTGGSMWPADEGMTCVQVDIPG